MKNRITIGILFFLFLLTASGVFAGFSQNPRQGSLAISVTSQPGSAENAAETHQGLTCIILNPVSVGAFTTKDPIGFNGGYNLYRYADNNPIRFIDPWGLEPEFAVIQDTIDPNKYFIFHISSGQIYDNSGRGYTLSDAEDIWQCDGVFVKFPGGKSPSETLQFIYTEATKLLIVHQSSAIFDEWVSNRYGVNPTNHTVRTNISESDSRHIFRENHNISDTPANRKLLTDTASVFNNYKGTDKWGNAFFAKNLPNGQQVWVGVRNGTIRYGGINETPKTFNSETGFSALNKPGQK